MNVQSQLADIQTPTGVMRTYIHKPVGEKNTRRFCFIRKSSNKLAQLNARRL